MRVKDILVATNGTLLSGDLNTEITGVTQDSRMIEVGNLYVPIIGENHDGHNFIKGAFDNGAVATFSSHDISFPDKVVIRVVDTLEALQQLAHYIRVNNSVKVVGITGSVGKTSTRDMIYSVVSQKFNALKTLGNFNNDIGLPLTISRYQGEDVMVLEMGMSQLGEISLLSKLAQPDIAVITTIGTAHIGDLGSRENILKAKLEIIDGVTDGVLIVNDDNDLLHQMEIQRLEVVRVGTGNCDIVAKNISLKENSSEFNIVLDNNETKVHVPLPGKHFVINALLAIAVGRQLDIPLDLCIKGIEQFELTKNRMDTLTLKNNIKIIDGTYNASEDSMKSSIDVLVNYQGRKICVLADMLDMGDYAKELHQSVGKYVAEKGIDMLICKGENAKFIQQAAMDNGMDHAVLFETNEQVIQYLDSVLQRDDVLLCKGSNGMHMKEIVEYLKGKF